MYTIAQKVGLIMLCTKHRDCARKATTVFNKKHPGKNVGYSYVSKLVEIICNTGSVQNRKHARATTVV